ncbi:MAG: hypothetical protein GX072_10680 [Lysinibacillus sp.]|nr:hypothetical protein [Lysinibacillus sp.]
MYIYDLLISATEKGIVTYDNGETIVKNTGNTEIFLYGSARHITFKETNEEPIHVFELKPNNKVVITTTEENIYGFSSIYIRDLLGKGYYSFAVYNEYGEDIAYNINVDSYRDNFLDVYPDGKSIIWNNGPSELTIFGLSRYILIEPTNENPF